MTNQDTLMLPEEISRRQYQERDNISRAGGSVRSYRVMVLTPGDQDWVGNGMRYRTPGIAREAADSLAWRWTAVRATTVFPSADEPNCDDHGNLL